MKKTILVFIAILIFSNVQSQEVPEVQNNFIVKKTATWCAPCGGYGWDLFEELIKDNKDKALIWAYHNSGELAVPQSFGMGSFPGGSIPSFYFNNQKIIGTASERRAIIKSKVDSSLLEMPFINAIATNVTINDSVITVSTKTKVFKHLQGTYRIGVYLVENNIVAFQQGQGANALHKYVLRDKMGILTYGRKITSGATSVGTLFFEDFKIQIDDSWDLSNIALHVIIWKEPTFRFQNGTKYTLLTAMTSPTLKDVDLTIFPNPINTNTKIILSANRNLEGELAVYDILGHRIKLLSSGISYLKQGKLSYDIGDLKLHPGVYFVQFRTTNGVISRKAIVN